MIKSFQHQMHELMPKIPIFQRHIPPTSNQPEQIVIFPFHLELTRNRQLLLRSQMKLIIQLSRYLLPILEGYIFSDEPGANIKECCKDTCLFFSPKSSFNLEIKSANYRISSNTIVIFSDGEKIAYFPCKNLAADLELSGLKILNNRPHQDDYKCNLYTLKVF